MDVKSKSATSHATNTANNAVATATLAAPGTGLQYLITGFSASFQGALPTTGIQCVVTIGSITKNYGISNNPIIGLFEYPIPSGDNGAASITLQAGGVGSIGCVNISGFIIPSKQGGLTLTD